MKVLESIKTDRTLIRRLEVEDLNALTKLLCNNNVTDNMSFPDDMLTEKGVKGLMEMTINSYNSDQPLFAYVIEDNREGCFLGLTGFNPLEKNEVEVFYAFDPQFWGRGFATEILKALTNYIFASTDYTTLVAPITRDNTASIKVAEKNGFTNHGLREDSNYKDLVYIFKKNKPNE